MTSTFARPAPPQGAMSAAPLKPPAPPKRRASKWPLVMLGVLLALIGAMVAVIAGGSGQHRSVLAIRQPVTRGHVLTREDLMAVSISSDDRLETVPEGSWQSIVGQSALVDLPVGQVVGPSLVSTVAPVKDGQAIVGLQLEPGEVPIPTLRAGDHVDVVSVAPAGPSGAGSSNAWGSSEPLVRAAEVVSVSDLQTRKWVSLRVASADEQRVSVAAAAKAVRLVVVPGR